MDEKNLVCLNDGRYIIVNMNTGKASVLDLTLVFAAWCDWSERNDGVIIIQYRARSILPLCNRDRELGTNGSLIKQIWRHLYKEVIGSYEEQ